MNFNNLYLEFLNFLNCNKYIDYDDDDDDITLPIIDENKELFIPSTYKYKNNNYML